MNPGAAPVVVPEKLDALMPALMERRKIFKIDPAVAAIAQHSFDPNWREHAFADALDAIFAICGQWGPAHFRAASTETWQFCALHQPHAEAITKPGIAGLTHPDLLAEVSCIYRFPCHCLNNILAMAFILSFRILGLCCAARRGRDGACSRSSKSSNFQRSRKKVPISSCLLRTCRGEHDVPDDTSGIAVAI